MTPMERLQAALDAVQDIGVYPVRTIYPDGSRIERTAWQDGWNAALTEMHRVIVEKLGE